MINDIKKTTDQKMARAVDVLHDNFIKIRTGRAHASFLDHVMVSYYEVPTPLNQVAAVTVMDARTLKVSPWEKNLVTTIEKAILKADLGLNPARMGDDIRVPLPALTEERRKDMLKVVRKEAEDARVAVRNVRRDAMDHLKTLLKDKSISEDEERRAHDEIQKLTDKYVAKIDEALADKEKDMMEI